MVVLGECQLVLLTFFFAVVGLAWKRADRTAILVAAGCTTWEYGCGASCDSDFFIFGLFIIQFLSKALMVWTNDVWLTHGTRSPSLFVPSSSSDSREDYLTSAGFCYFAQATKVEYDKGFGQLLIGNMVVHWTVCSIFGQKLWSYLIPFAKGEQ